MRGLAGLLDWRLAGRLSAMQKRGFLNGQKGEVLLVPGMPNLPFEKVLVFGLGPRARFGEDDFRDAIERLARTLLGVHVRRAMVELPGRAGDAIEPERAVTLALECVGASTEIDAWWIVEDAAARQRIELRAVDEGRRVNARR
ncbi:MAG: M17 family peptidase N-terminal domain-containing protein [Polyangiaceae bacterium]